MVQGVQWDKSYLTAFEILQSVAKYLGLALVLMRGKFSCYFRDFFANADKIFILAGGLGTGLSFYGV